jgi:hypothetical protein
MNAAPRRPRVAALMDKQHLITDELPGRVATATPRKVWTFNSAGVAPTPRKRRKAKRTRKS